MGKHKRKIIDYRSINLAWLVEFKDQIFCGRLAPKVELVVATQDIGTSGSFEVHQGDTLRVTKKNSTSYTVTRPYGNVLQGKIHM